MDIIVTGATDLERLARRLKELGDNDLRKEMLRGIRNGTKPLIAAAKDSARDSLPREGGLNEVIARSKFGTRTRTSGRTPGVRVVGTSGHNIQAMDEGRLRHPVYGNRDVWVTQQITPGWFTKPMEDGADDVRRELVNVLDGIARRL